MHKMIKKKKTNQFIPYEQTTPNVTKNNQNSINYHCQKTNDKSKITINANINNNHSDSTNIRFQESHVVTKSCTT